MHLGGQCYDGLKREEQEVKPEVWLRLGVDSG
jgi:hypothetical protein